MAEIPQVSLVDADDKADIVHQRVSPSPSSLGTRIGSISRNGRHCWQKIWEDANICKSCQSSSLVKLLWDQHGDFVGDFSIHGIISGLYVTMIVSYADMSCDTIYMCTGPV